MNLYEEANRYFGEILKEQNSKLNESLKKKKLRESLTPLAKIKRVDIKKYKRSGRDDFAGSTSYGVTDGSLGKDVNQFDAYDATVMWEEDERKWYVQSDQCDYDDTASTTIAGAVRKAYDIFKDYDEYEEGAEIVGYAIDDSGIDYASRDKDSEFDFYLIDLVHVSDEEDEEDEEGGESGKKKELSREEVKKLIKDVEKIVAGKKVTYPLDYQFPNERGKQGTIIEEGINFYKKLTGRISNKIDAFDYAEWVVETSDGRTHFTKGYDLILDDKEKLLGEGFGESLRPCKLVKRTMKESFRNSPYYRAIKRVLNGDAKAADIVYDWYWNEEAFDDFDSAGEFEDYVRDDIYAMLDAADDAEEIRIVRNALGEEDEEGGDLPQVERTPRVRYAVYWQYHVLKDGYREDKDRIDVFAGYPSKEQAIDNARETAEKEQAFYLKRPDLNSYSRLSKVYVIVDPGKAIRGSSPSAFRAANKIVYEAELTKDGPIKEKYFD